MNALLQCLQQRDVAGGRNAAESRPMWRGSWNGQGILSAKEACCVCSTSLWRTANLNACGNGEQKRQFVLLFRGAAPVSEAGFLFRW